MFKWIRGFFAGIHIMMTLIVICMAIVFKELWEDARESKKSKYQYSTYHGRRD